MVNDRFAEFTDASIKSLTEEREEIQIRNLTLIQEIQETSSKSSI